MLVFTAAKVQFKNSLILALSSTHKNIQLEVNNYFNSVQLNWQGMDKNLSDNNIQDCNLTEETDRASTSLFVLHHVIIIAWVNSIMTQAKNSVKNSSIITASLWHFM